MDLRIHNQMMQNTTPVRMRTHLPIKKSTFKLMCSFYHESYQIRLLSSQLLLTPNGSPIRCKARIYECRRARRSFPVQAPFDTQVELTYVKDLVCCVVTPVTSMGTCSFSIRT